MNAKQRSKISKAFAKIAGIGLMALVAACSLQDANAPIDLSALSPTSSVQEVSKAIAHVEKGYETLGTLSLDEVERLGELDQATRKLKDILNNSQITANDKLPLQGRLNFIGYQNDEKRSLELYALKPKGRWFNAQELTPNGHNAAWLIIQHGKPEIQAAVLPELTIAARQGLLPASDVAMMADRIDTMAGRPQTYGSQLNCIGNKPEFFPLKDAKNVDALRREAGFEDTFEQYKTRLLATKPCG